jgi:hypothetical protein
MNYPTLKNLKVTQLLIDTEKGNTELDFISKTKQPFLLLLHPEIKFIDDFPDKTEVKNQIKT